MRVEPRRGPRVGVLATLLVVVLGLTGLAGCGGGETPSADSDGTSGELPPGRDAVVERVVDGDTVRVDDGESVRLIGINTPETVHPTKAVECFGREASAHLEELLPPGTGVRLVSDVEEVDRYDRTLAYLYRLDDGLFVNAVLVRDGFAEVATYPPNVEHADEFVSLQREARDEQRGLWQACGEVGVPADD